MFKYISHLIDNPDPVIIMPYGGYANDDEIHGQARVLEDEGIEEFSENTVGGRVLRSFKRFETDEYKNAHVRVRWQEGEKELISDTEGYVYLDTSHSLNLKHMKTLWIPVTYELIENEEVKFSITTEIMKPAPTAEYGIISDIDETIIETGLGSFLKWKVLVNTFLKTVDERLPLEGAQELYSLLHGGSTGYKDNPFFYLSNSPWNLYDYLISFLEKFKFPRGTLLLRDIGLENKKKESFLEGNKFVKISHILETYPKLHFILIGDAQDLDPDIYLEIARKYPSQIKAIYIRLIRNKHKMKKVKALIEKNSDIEVLLISDSDEAEVHARMNGWIV
ncbi:DUF2183 domain-containing protein [Galbibacter sp. BG1]|uniref:App1 family protein n=1 Tax=Galbibacter sp. BG1 TaxID=1170699 RepID=UPI0015BC3711|nr:phosphatase domain-containing protein [Galbibacter sp. BG1]QLE01532.1 DUF2183 domain-containing protein [Galbibacter sp. BG1]